MAYEAAATCRSTRWPPTGSWRAGWRAASALRARAGAKPWRGRPRAPPATRLRQMRSDEVVDQRQIAEDAAHLEGAHQPPAGDLMRLQADEAPPARRTSPEVGGCTPFIRLTKVDLPAVRSDDAGDLAGRHAKSIASLAGSRRSASRAGASRGWGKARSWPPKSCLAHAFAEQPARADGQHQEQQHEAIGVL